MSVPRVLLHRKHATATFSPFPPPRLNGTRCSRVFLLGPSPSGLTTMLHHTQRLERRKDSCLVRCLLCPFVLRPRSRASLNLILPPRRVRYRERCACGPRAERLGISPLSYPSLLPYPPIPHRLPRPT